MSSSEQNAAPPDVIPAKRGPKWEPSWQGNLGQLQHVSPRVAVSEAILNLIRSGELRPGMRLPSEPQLVQMTGISRSSVREAVRSLQTMGLVEVRRGQGTFICEFKGESVIDAQLLLLLEDRTVLENLVEVRRALDPIIARLAAERATDEDIEALRRALHEMNEAPSLDQWRPAHLAFHKALVDATHNIILMKVWGLLTLFLKDSPLVTGTLTVTQPSVHGGIFKAVAARDSDAALAAINQHVSDMVKSLRD